ncbi:MAG: glycosyltransferase family 39 protein, partial [Chloroflexi bacterium]|nr:glycosyltransferase family 39 protein [Chloroflexota bacterium]
MKHFAKRWDFALGLLLSASLLWPLVVAPYFSHDDNVQTIRIYEMHECIVDWQIPCRWVPDMGGGYGYPEFNYYAPLPYYVGEVFFALSNNILTAAKLTFATGFLLAFLSTYLAASALWGRLGGSLSAIFYMFAPYHARNLYGRGAMDELWAMAAIPLSFWAFVRLGDKPSLWNSLLLGAALAVVVLCHNLSAMLVVALLCVFAVVRMGSTRDATFAKHLVAAAFWALGFSAFYVLPALFESSYVHLETLTSNGSNYAEHFEDLHALLR